MELIKDYDRFLTKIDHCDFSGFELTDSLKRRVANEMLEFEECSPSKDELLAMTSEELAREFYSVSLDYCRGIGLM